MNATKKTSPISVNGLTDDDDDDDDDNDEICLLFSDKYN